MKTNSFLKKGITGILHLNLVNIGNMDEDIFKIDIFISKVDVVFHFFCHTSLKKCACH